MGANRGRGNVRTAKLVDWIDGAGDTPSRPLPTLVREDSLIVLEALLIASAFGSTAAPRVPVAIDSAVAVLASVEPAPADTGLLRFIRIPIDTPPPRTRPRAIQVSDWYSRRLTIHRYVAYGTIPVFARAVDRGQSAAPGEPSGAGMGESYPPRRRDDAGRDVHREYGDWRLELVGFEGAFSAPRSSHGPRIYNDRVRCRVLIYGSQALQRRRNQQLGASPASPGGANFDGRYGGERNRNEDLEQITNPK